MEERSSQLTIVVGASSIAEALRRSLVRKGVAHAGVATHLRGLRRSLVLGETDLVILCIALDQATLNRHGDSLRRLLTDHHCLPRHVRSIGLLTEVGLTRQSAELGCDVYVHDSRAAVHAARLLARRARIKRRSSTSRRTPVRDAWNCGARRLPAELVPLIETVTTGQVTRVATRGATNRSRSRQAPARRERHRSPRESSGSD